MPGHDPTPSADATPAADFYTGLVADLYGALKGHSYADVAPHVAFIEEAGEPALELGCGDGEPFLALLALGLDIEGLDSSEDLLARCRAAASAQGLVATLHHQRMEAIDLSRRYRSIFLAGPTFNLLPDDDAALAALRAIRRHLAPGGMVRVPLFEPEPLSSADVGRPRELVAEDGTVLRVTAVDQTRDEAARLQSTLLRYERMAPGGSTECVDRWWLIHWYTAAGFADLAAAADLGIVRTEVGGSEGDRVIVLSADQAGAATA